MPGLLLLGGGIKSRARRLLKRFEQRVEGTGREHVNLVEYVNPVAQEGAYITPSRMSLIFSTPLFDAASSSSTSVALPESTARQAAQRPQGFPPCGASQLTELANILAQEVFTVPREPEKRYAWDMRLFAISYLSTEVMWSCPQTSSKICGARVWARCAFFPCCFHRSCGLLRSAGRFLPIQTGKQAAK